MDNYYRAFKQTFVDKMHSKWPDYATTKDYFTEHSQGIKNGRIAEMRHGDVVGEHYLSLMIELLLAPPRPGQLDYPRNTTLEFLRAHDFKPTASTKSADVIDILCTRRVPLRAPDRGSANIMLRGFKGLLQLMQIDKLFDRSIKRCINEEEVAEAVRWMFIDVGQQMNPRTKEDPTASIAEAHTYMKISLTDYQARALAWWKVSPWTVMIAKGRDKALGVGIMLPITEAKRSQILDGECMTYDTTPDELHIPSQYILVEGLSPRPAVDGGDPPRGRRALLALAMAQIAAMSYFNRMSAATKLELISFAGTELHAKQLKAFGYAPTGKRMKDIGVEFYTRHIDPTLGDSRDFLPITIYHTLANLYIGLPPA